MKSWYDHVKKIVETRSCGYIDARTNEEVPEEDVSYGEEWEEDYVERTDNDNAVLLDAFTASMLLSIADALTEKNQKNFTELPIEKAVRVGWKLANKFSVGAA